MKKKTPCLDGWFYSQAINGTLITTTEKIQVPAEKTSTLM
jgi:hypothetical protein